MGSRELFGTRRTEREPSAALQGLAADNRQLGVPGSGSILASGLLGRSVHGQRGLLHMKPDLLGGGSGVSQQGAAAAAELQWEAS